ncbi:MAG: class I SAM-dependent methyltransferase [Bacteroidetes bacterium]|nr:class I SAM-dependent methyltransferase [Bacteroidota bacterium]MBU1718136.1 class I SAM-dependent methyltransferase [Bacteroidota bacterium]
MMEELKYCPVCQQEVFEKHLECKDHTVSGEMFIVVKCASCGFLFTNPRPDKTNIGKYYKAESYISHTDTSKGLISKLYKKVRNITIKKKYNLVMKVSGSPASLLDIGCGTGFFLSYCQEKGLAVQGVEPDEEARKYGAEKYGLYVFEEDWLRQVPDRKFDVVTMWHVLEHVHELKTRMETVRRILNPGGTVIIAVPNAESPDAQYYTEKWAAYDVPRHIYHFSKKDITRLVETFGFDVVGIKPMKFDSYYVSMLSEKIKGNKLGFVKGMFIGLQSNLKASGKQPNHSSLIYVLKAHNG